MNTARKFRRILAAVMAFLFLLNSLGLLLYNHECSELDCPVCQALISGRDYWAILLVCHYMALGLILTLLISDISVIVPPLLTPVRQKVKITS